jgi:hypothetical protein
MGNLSKQEIEALFDYSYFIKHIDDVFKRLGLTKTKKTKIAKTDELAPQAI